jgi:hypothetical protein
LYVFITPSVFFSKALRNHSFIALKILQIITLGDCIGGAQIHVVDLASELSKRNHDVTVVTGTNGLINERLSESNIKNKSLQYLRRNINLV